MLYGIKRIEYNNYREIVVVEFYPEIPASQIQSAMQALGLLKTPSPSAESQVISPSSIPTSNGSVIPENSEAK